MITSAGCVIIYSSKMLMPAKITSSGIKLCYKHKHLFQYFLMRGQYCLYLYLLARDCNLTKAWTILTRKY